MTFGDDTMGHIVPSWNRQSSVLCPCTCLDTLTCLLHTLSTGLTLKCSNQSKVHSIEGPTPLGDF